MRTNFKRGLRQTVYDWQFEFSTTKPFQCKSVLHLLLDKQILSNKKVRGNNIKMKKIPLNNVG